MQRVPEKMCEKLGQYCEGKVDPDQYVVSTK